MTQGGVHVQNWEGSIHSRPTALVQPLTVDDVVRVVTDTATYPSPVRAQGSGHSTTECAVADEGTLLDMSKMDRILNIDTVNKTVTAEAGATYLKVARALRREELQFYVNIELGSLSCGSAACTATKDASMPNLPGQPATEFGQVSSYVIGVKMVLPSGEIREYNEQNDPEQMHLIRSSYGMLGVICEVTFRVRPLTAMAFHHEVFKVQEFAKLLPELVARGESMMYYMFPHQDRIAVEFRQYVEGAPQETWRWKLRNWLWARGAPAYAYIVTRWLPRWLAHVLVTGFNRLLRWSLDTPILKAPRSVPTNQIIEYPEKSDWKRYTFSIWAIPEEKYADAIQEYFRFCQDYQRRFGYRCNLLNVGYRIQQDDKALFSYSKHGTVMTLDPVATPQGNWEQFLVAYNDLCSRLGGFPLFNQTKHLTPQQVQRAFGEEVKLFEAQRRQFDPQDRLLNQYFRALLQQ